MKKKVILNFLFIILTRLLFANDTYFYLAGGNITPIRDADVQIELIDQIIYINLQKDYYEVTVDYDFYNHGKTIDLDMQFPYLTWGNAGNGKIWDFKCWTRGIEAKAIKSPIEKKWDKGAGLEYAFVKKIIYQKNKRVNTRVYYKSSYGQYNSSLIANYLYGTGAIWQRNIGNIQILIENNVPNTKIRDVTMAKRTSLKDRIKQTSVNSFEILLFNIEPAKPESTFEIKLEEALP